MLLPSSGAVVVTQCGRRYTNEAISGIEIIKCSANETASEQKICDARNVELKCLLRYQMLSGISKVIWNAVPVMVALSTFVTYTLQGNDLDAATAFTALGLFNVLRFPMSTLPATVISTSVPVSCVFLYVCVSLSVCICLFVVSSSVCRLCVVRFVFLFVSMSVSLCIYLCVSVSVSVSIF